MNYTELQPGGFGLDPLQMILTLGIIFVIGIIIAIIFALVGGK